LYALFFPPASTWEDPAYDNEYPFTRHRHLCDITNAHIKTGSETLKIIEKQLAAAGAYRYDIVGGTGDGGGENEGVAGVHSLMETVSPTYVRRRCLGHIPWRVADAGIRSMPHGTRTEDINVYLRDGVTWARLGAIACQSQITGGLDLMRFGSEEYRDTFASAPPRMIEDRPECTAVFLEWLIPKQAVLAKCIALDLEQRNLRIPQAPRALETLQNRMECILRCVDLVLVRKSLYLFYRTQTQPYIAQGTGSESNVLGDLIDQAVTIITDTACDDLVMKAFHIGHADLVVAGLGGHTTWMEVAVRLASHASAQECDTVLPDVLAYHQRVSSKMAAHLKLTADNIQRSAWLGAGTLCKDSARAQAAANAFLTHLIRTPAKEQTAFDVALNSDITLMGQLQRFAEAEPPTLLWRGSGAYKELFIFFATRFLGQPDSVLPCEGVHAQWKWIEQGNRGIKFKMLNAFLKIHNYIAFHGGLPEVHELVPHVRSIRQSLRDQYLALEAGGQVARGLRADWVYLDRFNLRPTDIDLVKAVAVLGAPKEAKGPEMAWGRYIKFLLVPGSFYSFDTLDAERFFYTAENKSLPGRDMPGEGAAVGRPLSIVWYQREEEIAGGIRISPCAGPLVGATSSLAFTSASVAEISQAAGYHPPVNVDDSARTVELKHERAFFSHGLLRWAGNRSPSPDTPWDYIVAEPTDAEEYYVGTLESMGDLTKMGLARLLQRRGGHTPEWRDDLYNRLNKGALLAAAGVDDDAPAAGGCYT